MLVHTLCFCIPIMSVGSIAKLTLRSNGLLFLVAVLHRRRQASLNSSVFGSCLTHTCGYVAFVWVCCSTIMQLSNELVYQGALKCGDDSISVACIQPSDLSVVSVVQWTGVSGSVVVTTFLWLSPNM